MTDTVKAFNYLLEDNHEVIIYGVLKRLGIRKFHGYYADLVQEGRLAFVDAYKRFPDDLGNDEKLRHFIYQGVYWHCLDWLRKQSKVMANQEDDDSALDIVMVSGKDENDVEVRVILDVMLGYLNENERQLINRLYYYGESMTKIAEDLQVSRQTLYNWRRNVIRKAKVLLGNELNG